jgi:hypothetical protein
MLSPYQPKVQQKLAHARLLLESCAACGDLLPDRQKREAFLSSAVMQLGVAYGLYLKELASQHQLPSVQTVHTLDQLSHELLQRNLEDLSVSELQRLAQEGWLSDLNELVQQAQYPAVALKQEALAVEVSLIASSNSDAGPDMDEQTVTRLLMELTQLVERQRHSNLEY